ncbi:MAG TPA: DNA cytosine methyltransferase [Kiritimatiellia bacterium]|nr:DNA cytosine methyltransferase [Kiritimatiellia bacterium]HMO99749.1 DNA cytosine methyltransferase [Kiritimatiellia bacterium]HMP00020.1 DNA cytosine methyltransferase [Kiritimatiellia bacterium]HMP97318.1 DNA cytosine methyltransferase [Kiritimatiellia bacterium]
MKRRNSRLVTSHEQPARSRSVGEPARVVWERDWSSTTHSAYQLSCLDLFCGCGGFSLGMKRAGFHILAAIDFNADAIRTLKANLPDVEAINADLTKYTPEKLAAKLGFREVDVIVGGPPCQGFSTARQRDGANHGNNRLVYDERRKLYREFLCYVAFFQPKVFVMENVLGIRSAAGGEYFTAVQKEARQLGYRVHGQIEDAWDLGVPQKRRRQLFVGVRVDLSGYFHPKLTPAPRAKPRLCLGAAIGDLPILRAGGGEDERDYDLARRSEYLRRDCNSTRNYIYKVLEIRRAAKLTNHVARPHNDRDLRDFAKLREGENSATAMRDRGVMFEFPYDTSSFKDRYTRQSRWRPCSTIVAHLSKDGLMFIHPTQNRSITPREAARIQSFPDWFRFPKARTHAFRLIGNAVPPLVAEAVGLAIRDFLGMQSTVRKQIETGVSTSSNVAALKLQRLANLDRRALRALSTDDFLQGWRALLYLFPDLHPDNALDHGSYVEDESPPRLSIRSLGHLTVRRYARSGWPVSLVLIGLEAWRRFENGRITSKELYCAEVQGDELHTVEEK